MELYDQFESAMKNTSVEDPNLYIVAHGNSPSKTITISKKRYEYNDSNYTLTIPPGFILVVFTPENMQQWGSIKCLQPDLEAFNSEWYKTDHIFSKYAKLYTTGDTFINMCLKFERAKYFNAYNVYDSNPYTIKTGKKTFQLKTSIGLKQFTLQHLFDELYKHKTDASTIQVIYLMACNPYLVTIDDAIEETTTSHLAIAEHAKVTKLRRDILHAGQDTFNKLTPSTKVKWTGSVRKQEKTGQLNRQHLNTSSHPYFTLTSNSVVNHETFRKHEVKDAEKGTIAALAGLLTAKRTATSEKRPGQANQSSSRSKLSRLNNTNTITIVKGIRTKKKTKTKAKKKTKTKTKKKKNGK